MVCKLALSIYLSTYLPTDLQPFVGPWTLFQVLKLFTQSVGPFGGDQTVARPLHAYRSAQSQNIRTETSMSQVGFEPTIPVFERTKTIHALDRAATVIDFIVITSAKNYLNFKNL
jgi:hypothetical protein